jgi:hypothetical protein
MKEEKGSQIFVSNSREGRNERGLYVKYAMMKYEGRFMTGKRM